MAHDSTTGKETTLDDLLEEWEHEGGWRLSKEDGQRLVDEVGVLRDLLDHAVQSWSPRGTGRAPIFAEWDDTDWADSGWTEPERYELRAAVARVEPPTSTRGNVRGHR